MQFLDTAMKQAKMVNSIPGGVEGITKFANKAGIDTSIVKNPGYFNSDFSNVADMAMKGDFKSIADNVNINKLAEATGNSGVLKMAKESGVLDAAQNAVQNADLNGMADMAKGVMNNMSIDGSSVEATAKNLFKNKMENAFNKPEISSQINDACSLEKNTEILNVIYTNIKNHIEKTFMEDYNADINNIVFKRLMELVETPGSELFKAISGCLNKYPKKDNTFFFHLKEYLPKYIKESYGVGCSPTKKVGGGGKALTRKKMKAVKSKNKNDLFTKPKSKTKKIVGGGDKDGDLINPQDIQLNKNLSRIISGVRTTIEEKLKESINETFSYNLISDKINAHTKQIVGKIADRIVNSDVLNQGDIFSVIYFYLMLERIAKNKDEIKKDMINNKINKLTNKKAGNNSDCDCSKMQPVAQVQADGSTATNLTQQVGNVINDIPYFLKNIDPSLQKGLDAFMSNMGNMDPKGKSKLMDFLNDTNIKSIDDLTAKINKEIPDDLKQSLSGVLKFLPINKDIKDKIEKEILTPTPSPVDNSKEGTDTDKDKTTVPESDKGNTQTPDTTKEPEQPPDTTKEPAQAPAQPPDTTKEPAQAPAQPPDTTKEPAPAPSPAPAQAPAQGGGGRIIKRFPQKNKTTQKKRCNIKKRFTYRKK